MLNGNRTKSNRGRSPRDFYITPLELADAAIHQLRWDYFQGNYPKYVLDAGCGTGIWGLPFSRESYVCGIDINPNVDDLTMHYYDEVKQGDFLRFNVMAKYDLVYGNPPYSLAEQFIRHSFDLIQDKGYIYFLLRLSFLEGMKRGKGLFKEFPIKRVYICSRRPSFYSTNGKHTTDTLAYAMFLWQKGYAGKTELSFLDWEYKK